MFKLYYAAAIDTCVEKAFKQIEEFKKLFVKYQASTIEEIMEGKKNRVNNPISVYGAGFGASPIIGPETSQVKKGVISAYDLRKIRECDILLVVTDLKQFAAGTMMELEYARNLGIYTILMLLSPEDPKEREAFYLKNIFLETYVNKVISSKEQLEDILKDLTQ
jgi:nucleoside 2-deoxyribosyltransferase